MNSSMLTANATNSTPEKQGRRLALFQEINQLVASDNSTETIVQNSLGLMLDHLDYCAAQVYRLSTGGNDVWLYLEVGNGHKPVTQTGDIFSIDETNIISDSARQAELIYISNIDTGPYSYYDSGNGVTGSEVAIPLRFGSELLGVLRVQAVNPGGFSPNDISYLSSLADMLATTIRNQRKISQLEDSIQEIKTLYKLQYQGKLEQQQLRVEQAQPIGYEYIRTGINKTTDLADFSDLNIPDIDNQTGVTTLQTNGNNELVAPIRLHNETIGVLGLQNLADEAEWTRDDISLLEEVSSQVALAIENSRLLQQTQEQTNELSILFEATRQLTETIDLQQIFHILTGQTLNYLNADRCSVLLLNDSRTHFETAVTQGRDEKNNLITLTDMHLVALDSSPALQQMIKHPNRTVIHADDPGFKPALLEQMIDEDKTAMQTLARFPLIVRSKLVGLLEVTHFHQPHHYATNELQLTQAIISQATVAIENAQLFQQTQLALEDTQKLYSISRKLVESTGVDEIFEIVLSSVKSYDVDRVSISLIDRDSGGHIESTTIVASWDRDSRKQLPVGTRFYTQHFSLVNAFAKPPFHPLISNDLRRPHGQDTRMDEAFRQYALKNLEAITLFSAPMFLGSEYKGVLSIYTRKPHTYGNQEIRLYQTLADQAIIAIENFGLLQTTRQERDRASLLYQLGQALGHTTSVGEVQNIVLSFIPKVGATDGELYITDGTDFVSLASTVITRNKLTPEGLAAIGLSQSHEALALTTEELVMLSKPDLPTDDWPLVNIDGLDHVQSLVSVPFFSQRSTLQGVLNLYHTQPDGFAAEQIAMFESVAIQTAASLENAWLLRQTNFVLHETELLYNITRGFNGAKTVDDLLTVIARNLVDTEIDSMMIALIDELDINQKPQRLSVASCWFRMPQEQSSPHFTLTPDRFEFVSNLYPDTTTEIYTHSSSAATQANIDEFMPGTQSMLAIPLVAGKEWLGVLLLASQSQQHEFKVTVINQISTLAGQAAVVIKNLQLVDKTQQNLFNSQVLSDLGRQLLTAETTEAIYKLGINAVAATQPDRGAAIFMYDQIEGSIDLELTAVWDNPRREWSTLPVGSRLSTEELGLVPLLKTGDTVISNNAPEDPRFTPMLRQLLTMMQIRVMVAVPVWINKEVDGFVLVGHQDDSRFSADSVRLYEDIARDLSGALDNRRLFDEARHRAWQLQTAADISQTATASLDMDALLFESVELIKERFNFYHASIFLLDDYQRYAVVRASTGQIGQKMLEMGHKLEVGGKSIVGAATGSGKPKIALDVGKDATHFNNPLLPNTRSEMALPLIVQSRVIGALDVQSARRGAFSDSDITVLQSMANQLANAIEAARAYRESKESLEEVRKLHEHYMTEKWNTFLSEQGQRVGFQLEDEGQVAQVEAIELNPALSSPLVSAQHAMVTPQTQPAENGNIQPDSTPPEVEPSTLVAPLTLYGQSVIGSLDFELPQPVDTENWNEDLLTIVDAVSAQAAEAIEAARLYQQSQVAREEAEALYQVGRALVTAETNQEMFNTVLGKMLETLGLAQGGILFFNEDMQTGRLHALVRQNQPVDDPDVEFPIAGNESYQKLIETKLPVAITDMRTDPLVERVRQLNLAPEVISLLLVPIIINDAVIGAIGADSVEDVHYFTAREINLAMAMADQLSIALQNRRLIHETRRRAALLQTSSDVGRAATSILDESVMMDEVVELIREGFNFEHVQIYLMDEDGQHAALHKSELLGLTKKVTAGDSSVVGQAIKQRQAVATNAPPEKTDRSKAIQSELAIPLQVGNILIGALNVQSSQTGAFTDEEVSTLETLAAQLVVAIQNARAFREAQETAERLKEVDKLKTQFLANMSHELRTPLNSIIGFSRVILKGIDGPLTELQKADLTSIYGSGQHLLGLINNILDLSKIEAGKMELNFEETDVEPIIKTVLSTAVALVKDKPINLKQEIPETLPKIWADPTRIRQIVLNLVSNACKFTEDGTVVVRVTTDAHKVTFSVSDTGIGIPEEKLEHIFEEFTQVDASTTRKAGGTGLGLPISRHFVEMHHGQIWVQSRLGRGTTFSFYIPTTPPTDNDALSDGPVVKSPPPEKATKLVVAIDDDPKAIDLYRRYLETSDYQVIGLNSGKDALEKIKNVTPFAILLDILIPEKDGWVVLNELKGNLSTKNIPVIICSMVGDKNRGYLLGAANYLIKPIIEAELLEALNQLDDRQRDETRVLVVDDHADDILLIRRILEAQSNYTIFEAHNGQEGLQLVQSKLPNLIIVDLKMPEMDGFAMIESLKANPQTRDIPIIVVSAQELDTDEQDRLNGQVEVFLRKGIFTEQDLLEDVSHALEQIHQSEQAIL